MQYNNGIIKFCAFQCDYHYCFPDYSLAFVLDGLKPDTVQVLSANKKKAKGKQQTTANVTSDSGAIASVDAVGQGGGTVKIALNFKRYVFDPNKRMIQ